MILAGDIARPAEAIAWASRIDKPVLYVPGNHEFYGASVEGTLASLRTLCQDAGIHLLDNDEVVLSGVRFLRTTLWTDFRLFTKGTGRTAAEREASFDYQVNGVRVVCNPRGYARDGVNENAGFDPDFIVEVGSK